MLDTQLGERRAAQSVPRLSMPDILAQERPQLQKQLSRAVCARRHLLWQQVLHPASRAAGILAGASTEGRRCLASEWLLSTPATRRQTIADNQYRIMIKVRLGIELCAHGEQCRVRARDAPAPCTKQLTSHVDHAFACAKAARQVTHDSVADLCAAFHREAGNRAWREAAVPEAHIHNKQKPIRADVLVRRGPIDPVECTEVKMRHLWHTSGDLQGTEAKDWDARLEAEERRVKEKYSPVRVKPWVFSTLGRPGDQFCIDIRRLARERLQKADARRCVSRESMRQFLLRRWRSELSCVIAIGVANTLLESIEGTATNFMQLVRPTALHDLQSYRFTGY
eukprot:gene25315-biopygen20968